MNERIRELVRQAGLDDADFPIENWDNVPLAKFAELIVRECTRIVINNGIATATHDQMVRQDCVNEIKHHFGVEE